MNGRLQPGSFCRGSPGVGPGQTIDQFEEVPIAFAIGHGRDHVTGAGALQLGNPVSLVRIDAHDHRYRRSDQVGEPFERYIGPGRVEADRVEPLQAKPRRVPRLPPPHPPTHRPPRALLRGLDPPQQANPHLHPADVDAVLAALTPTAYPVPASDNYTIHPFKAKAIRFRSNFSVRSLFFGTRVYRLGVNTNVLTDPPPPNALRAEENSRTRQTLVT